MRRVHPSVFRRRRRFVPVAVAAILVSTAAPGVRVFGDAGSGAGSREVARPLTDASAPEVVGEAYRALEDGRVDDAEVRFRAVLARDPGNLTAREGLIWTHVKRGAIEQAAEEADARLALSPDVAWRKQWIDVVSALPARRPAAIAAARTLIRERPSDPETYVILARVLATNREDFPEAVDAYDHALALAPDDMAVRKQRADTLVWSGRYAEAILEYRTVMAHAPDGEMQKELARALVLSARYAEAIDEYRQVIASVPDVRIHIELARTLVWAGRYDDAVSEYRAILGRLPGDRVVRRNLATALSSGNHPAEAIRILDELIAEDPRDPETLRERALLARWQRDFDTTRRLLAQAAAIEPGGREDDEDYIAPRPVEFGAARRDLTLPLLLAVMGVGIAIGQLRRAIDARTYVLFVAFTGVLIGIGLSWIYVAPGL